jgi:hypothetical protein
VLCAPGAAARFVAPLAFVDFSDVVARSTPVALAVIGDGGGIGSDVAPELAERLAQLGVLRPGISEGLQIEDEVVEELQSPEDVAVPAEPLEAVSSSFPVFSSASFNARSVPGRLTGDGWKVIRGGFAKPGLCRDSYALGKRVPSPFFGPVGPRSG